MSATVRVFAMHSLTSAPVAEKRYSSDAVMMLRWPYLARETLTVDTGTAQSTASATAPDKSNLLHVQVQTSKYVHFEVNPPSRAVTATTDSPIISGDVTITAGPGWTISFLEVA